MLARTTKPTPGPNGTTTPAGTTVDHPMAFRLCQQGLAEPIDDECRAKLEELARKRKDRLAAKWDRLAESRPAPAASAEAPLTLAAPGPKPKSPAKADKSTLS